jgi:CelD/BcsL family acetyltransferase involved in cellulose biosynthesis
VEGAQRLAVAVIEDRAELEALAPAWDALAEEVRAPFGAPAWALAWWRHLAPRGARLAVVAAHDGGRLVGLAPFFASRRLGVTELRLISADFASRADILCRPGRESEVAAALAAALADGVRPDALRWEGIDAATEWPQRLSRRWPGERTHTIAHELTRPGPVLELDAHPSYEDWLGAKSRHFRRRLRQGRRAIERRGARFRLSDRASLAGDLASFERLHTARWRRRGGSTAVNAATMRMLREAGDELIEPGRFRLWMLDGPGGEPVSAELLLAAGGEVTSWNGGFDEAWGRLSPGIATLDVAIEDAYERGDLRLDLGGGAAGYKDRLADGDRPVVWQTSFTGGARYPLARLWRLPEQTARRFSGSAKALLGPVAYNRVRRALRV